MSNRPVSLLVTVSLVAVLVVSNAVMSRAGGAQLVDVVYIATGENFPDALAAGPATGGGGPILLVQKDAIPGPTIDELVRLNPKMIVIVGGPAVVSAAVEAQLAGYTTGPVRRIAGSNRYATAAAISADTFPVTGATSCPASGFQVDDDGFEFTLVNSQLLGSGSFSCAVMLPPGSTITSVRFTVRDNHGFQGVPCSMRRVDLTGGTFNFGITNVITLASAETSGVGTPGTAELIDSTIDNPLVDNLRYAYWLSCTLWEFSADLSIYGAIVYYRM
ncbi:MAG: cell wall-binding repeat-containing protein [Actinomycetota bacterium]|nr:cell wall-binding repeat-containing protein [Actinomycetota bacterium]